MTNKMKKTIADILLLVLLAACTPTPQEVVRVDEDVPMYPDYTDITIPVNIAPLNFLLRGEGVEAVCVYADDEVIYSGRGNEVVMDLDDWKEMMKRKVGKDIKVRVCAKTDGKWKEYRSFVWSVVADEVDAYLTYRLIEPDYEVYNNLVLQERCMENFDTKNFCDYRKVGNKCMNCHNYAGQSPERSMFYVRGEGGGAILNENGNLIKLNLRAEDMASGSVYYGFSPDKRFVVFSTNVIIPAFHSEGSKRLEVFDTKSDVYAADLVNHTFIRSELLSDSTQSETFPTFSPDGKYVYYCTAQALDSLGDLKHQRYSLCRIEAPKEGKAEFGTVVDTIYNGREEGKSVCHPRISPDGRYLVFSTADYGTFPIWHREARLEIMDLSTMEHRPMKLEGKMKNVGSDSYHSWSSNSRWMVFASKRDDGLYGKPYFTYINKKGVCSKPFVLPQAHPTFYDNCLKSFNAPELGTGPLPFDADDVRKAMGEKGVDFE